ncbi:Protein CBG06297 [Caenorhabditis briggsae]|uniref:Protein CBG06297 n=1 Tax=Caenorhabditis briggsae TaxID=6238 RepID=A8X1W4_CAEBR|nr:Protein CBG06297 [Caenorhabditis briggsae]CAP26624.2 Protein CBG06297 [Caenorhabditis briggsae]
MSTTASRNIWNTNLDTYYYIKRSINLIFTPLFPLILFCVYKKSPKNFGSLKLFLYFHVFCISIQWLYNCLLIDTFQFVPSPFVQIMGFLTKFVNPVHLYIANYCCTSTFAGTLGSCQTLFCNRLFKILHLYNSKKSPSSLPDFTPTPSPTQPL